MTFPPYLWPHPKITLKIFKNQKMNAASWTPIQYTTFHQHTFTKYLYFLRYRPISTFDPIFSVLSNLNFWPKEPKNLNFPKSFVTHYPQPKLNNRSPNDPKLIILTMEQVYTYFWQTLPAGALISVAIILFTFSSALQWCNLLNSPENHCHDSHKTRTLSSENTCTLTFQTLLYQVKDASKVAFPNVASDLLYEAQLSRH